MEIIKISKMIESVERKNRIRRKSKNIEVKIGDKKFKNPKASDTFREVIEYICDEFGIDKFKSKLNSSLNDSSFPNANRNSLFGHSIEEFPNYVRKGSIRKIPNTDLYLSVHCSNLEKKNFIESLLRNFELDGSVSFIDEEDFDSDDNDIGIVDYEDTNEEDLDSEDMLEDDFEEDDEDLTPMRKLIMRDFWELVLKEIKTVTSVFNRRNPLAEIWLGGPTGISGIHYTLVACSKYIRIEIYIRKKGNPEFSKKIFDYLYSNKSNIEDVFGENLTWERMDDKISSRIKYEIDSNIYDKSNWKDGVDFYVNYFPKFEKAFKKYLDAIKKGDIVDNEDIAKEPTITFEKYPAKDPNRVENPFIQSVCILGEPGVGKSLSTIQAIEKDTNHEFYLSIPTDLSTSMLVQFVGGELKLNKISKMIIKAYENPKTKYTVLIDEFHKPLTIKRVNDELLQAISTKRFGGRRFISSEIAQKYISKKLKRLGFDDKTYYSYHGNIEIPDNFGFIFLSSKPNIVVSNDDLYERMDIVYITDSENRPETIEKIQSYKISEPSDKNKFKNIIKDTDDDNKDEKKSEILSLVNKTKLDKKIDISSMSNESFKNDIIKFDAWRKI